MATIRIHDLETGEIVDRDETLQEATEREAVEAAAADATQAAQTTEAKKAAILAALADATGYTADELREALNA